MWPLTVLTKLFYKEIFGRFVLFAWPKKGGRNNEFEVTVLPVR